MEIANVVSICVYIPRIQQAELIFRQNVTHQLVINNQPTENMLDSR